MRTGQPGRCLRLSKPCQARASCLRQAQPYKEACTPMCKRPAKRAACHGQQQMPRSTALVYSVRSRVCCLAFRCCMHFALSAMQDRRIWIDSWPACTKPGGFLVKCCLFCERHLLPPGLIRILSLKDQAYQAAMGAYCGCPESIKNTSALGNAVQLTHRISHDHTMFIPGISLHNGLKRRAPKSLRARPRFP